MLTTLHDLMVSRPGEGQTDKQGLYQRKWSDRVLTTLHDVMESRHGEGQTDKQGLYQRKRSDRVLTTYTRYVLRWAASEKF